ncbi:MAG TPA: hypothetical protein VMV68_05470 [Spirochaetia bacterium]|nr:hypothetical protein [Spirochaetia bacterium]
MKALALVVTLGLFLAPTLPAKPTSGLEASGAASSSVSSPQSLFESTLPLDIDTAGYYELLAWVRRLGLSDTGSRTDLQSRLRQYYHLPSPAPAPSGTTKPAVRTITIKSARTTEYFTLEKVGQKYIRLSGGVDLEMYDPSTDTTHSILADTILFNQTEKTITATGHITYSLIGKDKTEVFRGQSLTFNVDSWEGIFFQGVSESEKKINDTSLTFYYSGQTIQRSKNDVVTLEDGTITSSSDVPPDYQIKARKIWILAPGEWALSSATLYLGRIPILYFPYFFHPGDNLFFNPSMGYLPERGYYLQTTTYLLGHRQKQNSSLSFLQVAEDTNVTYNTKIRGLFLRKTTPVSQTEQSATPYDYNTSYVRLLLDIYSRLGVFGGIESKFANFGIIKDLELTLDFARSRDIFTISGASAGGYSQFLPLPDGTTTMIWNTSNLGGIVLPFRYGADLEATLGNSIFSVTASIPFYSDPNFVRDFGTRQESVDWSKILGLSGSTTTTASTTSTLPQPMTSLLWSLHSTLTPNTGALSPYLGQFSLTNLDASVYWQTKNRATSGVPGLDPSSPNYVGTSYQGADFIFPERQFFYPLSITFPSIQASITGTIFSNAPSSAASAGAPTTPASPGAANAAGTAAAPANTTTPAAATTPQSTNARSTSPPAGGSAQTATAQPGSASTARTAASPSPPPVGPARPPWTPTVAPPQSGAGEGLRTQKLQPDIPITTPATLLPYTQSLTYSILPTLSVEDQTVADSWTSPADISLSSAYSIFTGRGTGSLTYSGAVWSSLLSFQDTASLSGSYKIHYNRNYSVADWQSFLEQDYDTTFLKLTNTLNVSSAPFQNLDLLRGSSLKYSIAAQLYSRDWVAGSTEPLFANSYVSWDKSHITTHSFSMTLDVTPGQTTDSLAVTTVLPPLDPQLSTTVKTGPLTSIITAAWSIPTTSSPWVPQPLTIEENLVPVSWLTLDAKATRNFNPDQWGTGVATISAASPDNTVSAQESLTYDLYNQYPTDSTTTLNLWFMNFAFEAQRTTPYLLDLTSGWIAQSSQDFVPSSFSFGVSYDYKTGYLWKNRVNFETSVQSAYKLSLLKFTDNSLTLNLTAKLSIYRFLDLSFTLSSEDDATYLYFPSYASQVGGAPVNPIVDLLKSINIFNPTDRTESNFKMKSVDLKLVHHLGDWDLNLEYTGAPQLSTSSSGIRSYKWTPTFTISVSWISVPEIKSNIEIQPANAGQVISF